MFAAEGLGSMTSCKHARGIGVLRSEGGREMTGREIIGREMTGRGNYKVGLGGRGHSSAWL